MTRLVWLLVAWLSTSAMAWAQGAPDLPEPAEAGPAPAAECVPKCRTGYLCHQGQCVSECNPPCETGESCAAGECIPNPPPAPPAPVNPTPEDAEPHQFVDPGRRHTGFFLRFTIGLGGGATTIDDEVAGDFQMSGGGVATGLDIGGAPMENLILHVRSTSFVYYDSDVVGGFDATIWSYSLGAALTYYFMPINLYLTGSIGPSWSGVDSGTREIQSDTGFALTFDFGKEWWVGREWGLGVIGRLFWNHIPVSSTVDVQSTFGAVMFSATWN